LEHLKIIRFSSTSDCQDLFGRRLVVRVGTSKGSTISHMATVHPGALATGSPTEKKKKNM
jgi:tRNA G46 methylase TrmB